jgi:hypothetical protein
MSWKQVSPIIKVSVILSLINALAINNLVFRNREIFSEQYIVQFPGGVSVFPENVGDDVRGRELFGELA